MSLTSEFDPLPCVTQSPHELRREVDRLNATISFQEMRIGFYRAALAAVIETSRQGEDAFFIANRALSYEPEGEANEKE